MRHITKYLITVLAVLFGGFPMVQGALAEPVAAPLAVLENGSGAPGIGSALSSDDLEGVNGRKCVDINIKEVTGIFSSTDQTGFLDQNSIEANHSTFTTGANTIAPGAFSYMNGVATVIQNSGNQVLIQNATVVDVIVK
ncbi:hypothetical protein [Candidatus Deferrimicrobium sp.]|uniref:hypothetical protein n=1 Tax=Candidatus Deferrimicrobium sp. TaxID=3060586 RepID=UPI003C697A9C